VLVHGQCSDRSGGRSTNARQGFKLFLGAGHLPGVVVLDNLRGSMQVARSGIVAKPRPMMQHIIYGRFGQSRNVREPLHKALVVPNYRRYLGLLQHNFADPDPVWIDLLLPR
jgi:hypothetical protein